MARVASAPADAAESEFTDVESESEKGTPMTAVFGADETADAMEEAKLRT